MIGERIALLTPREKEVLQGIFEGKLTKVIAQELGIDGDDLRRPQILGAIDSSPQGRVVVKADMFRPHAEDELRRCYILMDGGH